MPDAEGTITIAGTAYDVVEMDGGEWQVYRSYLIENAKRRDRPIERFIRQHCAGLNRDERQDVLSAWIRCRGWDNPSESLVREVARHPNAVASLCARVLRPKQSAGEWTKIVNETNAQSVYAAICAALEAEGPPTPEQIIEHNKKLREIINRAAQQGSPACQERPQ
jgi:hypothetical protein